MLTVFFQMGASIRAHGVGTHTQSSRGRAGSILCFPPLPPLCLRSSFFFFLFCCREYLILFWHAFESASLLFYFFSSSKRAGRECPICMFRVCVCFHELSGSHLIFIEIDQLLPFFFLFLMETSQFVKRPRKLTG